MWREAGEVGRGRREGGGGRKGRGGENLERSDYYPICCSDLPTVLFY